jgi:hypothetical protein
MVCEAAEPDIEQSSMVSLVESRTNLQRQPPSLPLPAPQQVFDIFTQVFLDISNSAFLYSPENDFCCHHLSSLLSFHLLDFFTTYVILSFSQS